MRSEALKQYIRDRGTLFWYSPGDKGETVTDELLVEHILNYGTMDDVRELFRIMGLGQVAAVFRNSISRMSGVGITTLRYHCITSRYFSIDMHLEVLTREQSELLPFLSQFAKHYYLVVV